MSLLPTSISTPPSPRVTFPPTFLKSIRPTTTILDGKRHQHVQNRDRTIEAWQLGSWAARWMAVTMQLVCLYTSSRSQEKLTDKNSCLFIPTEDGYYYIKIIKPRQNAVPIPKCAQTTSPNQRQFFVLYPPFRYPRP